MSCPCNQNSGLGFLPADDGGDGGAIAGIIGGIIAGISAIFGGGDDQATSYKPPTDSATRFVAFDDKLGQEQVAYDATSAQSLQQGMANGNRLEDIYSYYSAFITGNVNSGASPAAATVIKNTAAAQGVSIQRAADIILKVVGLIRSVKSLFTSPPSPTYQAPRIPSQQAPPQYQTPTYTQQPTNQTPQYEQPGASGSSNAPLLLGGFLLLLFLARRRQ